MQLAWGGTGAAESPRRVTLHLLTERRTGLQTDRQRKTAAAREMLSNMKDDPRFSSPDVQALSSLRQPAEWTRKSAEKFDADVRAARSALQKISGVLDLPTYELLLDFINFEATSSEV